MAYISEARGRVYRKVTSVPKFRSNTEKMTVEIDTC